MAELKTIQEAEELAPSCGLCGEKLRKPRVLPCLDIFCLQCLERHFEGATENGSTNHELLNGQTDDARLPKDASSSQHKCPTCEQEFSMPSGGIRRLSLSAHMQSLTDILNVEEEGICQFCADEERKAETYCLDCSLSMCKQCRKMHGRVSGTSRHNLIPLQRDVMKDAKTDVSAVLKSRSAECKRHDQQPVMYCCVTCDALLCVSCKMEEHSEHQVEPLDKAAQHRRESLVDIITLLQDHKKSTRDSVHTAMEYLVEMKKEFVRGERHVEKLAKRLIEEITREKNKVLHQLSVRRESEERCIKLHVSSLERAQAQVTNATYYTQSVISFASDAEVLRVSRIIVDRYRDIRRHQDLLLNRRLRVMVIKAPRPPAALLPEIDFGVRLEEVYPELQAPVIVSTLKTDGAITGLVPMADDRIAVVNFCSQKVSVYKRTGRLVTEIRYGMMQPVATTLASSEQVYVTDMGNENRSGMGIRTISTEGKLLPGHVALPMKPWGLAVTKEGNFVVCHPDRHVVCIYTPNGKLKRKLRSATPDEKLFLNPRCVTVNLDGCIIVSDFAAHNVRIFDPEGNLKVTYGSEGTGNEQLRHPCGVCCDHYGHIIIADSNNHRLHVLSARGELRGYLAGGEGGVLEPVAVAVTQSGELLVGEWEGQIHVVRYL